MREHFERPGKDAAEGQVRYPGPTQPLSRAYPTYFFGGKEDGARS
jgi:hypothetical protein